MYEGTSVSKQYRRDNTYGMYGKYVACSESCCSTQQSSVLGSSTYLKK